MDDPLGDHGNQARWRKSHDNQNATLCEKRVKKGVGTGQWERRQAENWTSEDGMKVQASRLASNSESSPRSALY